MEDVVLAICQSSSDRYYIVGGRHRLTAIAATIYQVVTAKYTNEDTISDLLDAALDQEIRCNVVYLTELDDLIKLIKSNNDSRKMRKFEDKHMDIQKKVQTQIQLNPWEKRYLTLKLNPLNSANMVHRISSVENPA